MKNSQIDEKNSQIDENTPVAEQEKPGPNRGEESETDEEMKKKMKERKEGAMATPPIKVVKITPENIRRISYEHNGMLLNEDGSLSRTPQYETFLKDKFVQLERTYSTTPVMPEELEKIPGHPRPTDKNLNWSHRGKWQVVPEDPNSEGSEQENDRVARVEPYIDTEGRIKKAICYGEEADHLNTWFDLEEVLKVYKKWKMPVTSKYFNNRKFSRYARRDWQESNKRREYAPERRSRREYSPDRRDRNRREYSPDIGRKYSGHEK